MIARDFLGNSWEFDCMGCAIAKQSFAVPGGLIRQTRFFCVHQDPFIPLTGFLVIASRRHIRSIGEMTKAEYAEFTELFKLTQAAIKKATQIEYLTLIQEEHSSHFHLWFFPWLPDIIRKHGKPSLTKVREIMAEVSLGPIDAEEWRELAKTIERIKAFLV